MSQKLTMDLWYRDFFPNFRKSLSVCPWQAYLALCNGYVYGQEPTLEWSTWQMLHSGRSLPYSQT
jgi:hypothetical protein